MADLRPSDEQRVLAAFQQVIDVLQPLKTGVRERAYATVGAFFGFNDAQAPAAPAPAAPAPASKPAKKRTGAPARSPAPAAPTPAAAPAPSGTPTAKAFLSEKQPKTDVERVACYAYFLTEHRSTRLFATGDINTLNTEAEQRKFANASSTLNNAIRAGLLSAASRGKKQITTKGKSYVEALPDQAAARALTKKPRKKRKRRASSTAQAQ